MIDQLKRIVDATGAEIVLSSTWRLCNGMPREQALYDALISKLAEHGLSVMDSTPSFSTYRGDEIDAWLQAHPECDNFIILDDMNDMKPHGRRLIQTPELEGLTEKHANKAIKMLNEPLERYW